MGKLTGAEAQFQGPPVQTDPVQEGDGIRHSLRVFVQHKPKWPPTAFTVSGHGHPPHRPRLEDGRDKCVNHLVHHVTKSHSFDHTDILKREGS